MTAPVWWDITNPKKDITKKALIDALGELKTDQYVIGEEIGLESGYEHYQIRVHFKKPYTLNELIEFNKRHGMTGRWSPTSKNGKNFDYVEKEGKFYRSWEGALAKYHDMDLLPWQYEMTGAIGESNDRNIIVCYDPNGNTGKSVLAKWLEVHHIMDVCPVSSGESGEYIAYCMGYQAKGYVFDIPKCETLKDKKQMWKAIEQIKNGLLYDGRYSPRKTWIEPPSILVMTNDVPPFNHLSKDRWEMYELVRDHEGADVEVHHWNRQAIESESILQEAREEQERARRVKQ